jgi:uncharacterized coiled-coil protein SlyX
VRFVRPEIGKRKVNMKALSINNEIDKAIAASPGHGKYTAAKRKLEDLRSDLAMAKQDLEELRSQREPDTIGEAAERLLAGGPATAVAIVSTKSVALEQAEAKIAVLERALSMQEQTVRELNYERSGEISKLLKPVHERIVERAGAALKEAAEALALEEDLRREVGRQEISFGSIRPLGYPGDVGRLDVKYSAINTWLAEAREHGYKV